MKLNTNSNVYTVVYAAIVVVIVAFLLAFVSTALKSKSDANVENDTKKQILASLGQRNVADADVQATWDKYIVADLVVDTTGNIVKEGKEKDQDGFRINRKDIKPENNALPVFVANVDGQTKYVLPLIGKGLWGPIWGYIAVDADGQTVFGAYFDHESETAGLGAEIKATYFQDQFKGKKLETADGSATLTVVKNGKVDKPEIQADGISGATLTGNGVAAMLSEGISMYQPYLHKLNQQ
ncbi:MAG: NADH:ubiquinone reductase (Na(+)-transporting) subunit C [Bacteroidaceae bacterium]|nr:NADH:ubiquinone reductase (Na(+)-transporting) subunit C [Bacteroidaceae bacterium]